MKKDKFIRKSLEGLTMALAAGAIGFGLVSSQNRNEIDLENPNGLDTCTMKDYGVDPTTEDVACKTVIMEGENSYRIVIPKKPKNQSAGNCDNPFMTQDSKGCDYLPPETRESKGKETYFFR